MPETAVMQIKDTTANPAPLGLFGFGMTTMLLNFSNAGFFKLDTMILGMGICFGGAAQVIAGIQEWKKNNTFGATAFTSYGFFWLSFVALVMLPHPESQNNTSGAVAAYLAVWGLFTFALFLGTFRLSVALVVVFGSLTLLFFLLAVHDAYGLSDDFLHATGYEGIFCGFSAFYTGAAHVLNEIYGRNVLPLGPLNRPKFN